MKSLKISVPFITILLLISLSVSVSATPITEEFEFPVYANYEDTEFKFAIELNSSSELYTRAWFFDIELNQGLLEKSAIKAGDTVNVEETIKYDKKTGAVKSKKVDINIEPLLFEGKFGSFEVLQDAENKEQFNFLGTFEYSVLTDSDVELLYVYGNFVPLENEVFQTFSASISNFDPNKPIDPTQPIPEPATMLLVAAGMACIAVVRRKRKGTSLKTGVHSPGKGRKQSHDRKFDPRDKHRPSGDGQVSNHSLV